MTAGHQEYLKQINLQKLETVDLLWLVEQFPSISYYIIEALAIGNVADLQSTDAMPGA
jgi:hypothetical protein